MDEHVVDVKFPDGTMGKGIEVAVLESAEKFSEFTLNDGTILRVKLTLVKAVRNMGRFGPDGSPEYNFGFMPLINFVNVPEQLKRKP